MDTKEVTKEQLLTGIETVLRRLKFSADEAARDKDFRRETALLRCLSDLTQVRNGSTLQDHPSVCDLF